MKSINATKLLGTAIIAYAVSSAGVTLFAADNSEYNHVRIAKAYHYSGEITGINGVTLMIKDSNGASRTFTAEKMNQLEGFKPGDDVFVTLSDGKIESISKKPENKQAS